MHFPLDMFGFMSNTAVTAPSSPTSTRRRSSIFSGFASLSRSSSQSQSRRGSKWSVASCFSESDNSEKSAPTSQHDPSPPVFPLAASFEQSTVASRRKSYVPKHVTESTSTSPAIDARDAAAASANRASRRMTYATQYGYGAPPSTNPVETEANPKK